MRCFSVARSQGRARRPRHRHSPAGRPCGTRPRIRNAHARTRPARLPDQELEAAHRRRGAGVHRADLARDPDLAMGDERQPRHARGRQRDPRADPARGPGATPRLRRTQGTAHGRAGLRPGVQDVPRGGSHERAQVSRPGCVGEGHRPGPGRRDGTRHQGHSRDAAEGRQSGSRRRRSRTRRGVHGEQRRAQVGRSLRSRALSQ